MPGPLGIIIPFKAQPLTGKMIISNIIGLKVTLGEDATDGKPIINVAYKLNSARIGDEASLTRTEVFLRFKQGKEIELSGNNEIAINNVGRIINTQSFFLAADGKIGGAGGFPPRPVSRKKANSKKATKKNK